MANYAAELHAVYDAFNASVPPTHWHSHDGSVTPCSAPVVPRPLYSAVQRSAPMPAVAHASMPMGAPTPPTRRRTLARTLISNTDGRHARPECLPAAPQYAMAAALPTLGVRWPCRRCYNTLTGGLMIACRLVDWGGPPSPPRDQQMPCRHASPAAATAFCLFVCLSAQCHADCSLCSPSIRAVCQPATLVAVACVFVCLAVSEAAADVADPDHAAYFETAKLGQLYRMCTCAPVIALWLAAFARTLRPLCVCAQLPTGRKPAVGTRQQRNCCCSAAPNAIHDETTRTAQQ